MSAFQSGQNPNAMSYETQTDSLRYRQAEDALIMQEWGLLRRVLTHIKVKFDERSAVAMLTGDVPRGLLNEPLALRDDATLMPALVSYKTDEGEQVAVRLDAQASVEGVDQSEEHVVVVTENGEPAEGFTREDALITGALVQRLRDGAGPGGTWPDLSLNLADIRRPQRSHNAGNRRVPRMGGQAS